MRSDSATSAATRMLVCNMTRPPKSRPPEPTRRSRVCFHGASREAAVGAGNFMNARSCFPSHDMRLRDAGTDASPIGSRTSLPVCGASWRARRAAI